MLISDTTPPGGDGLSLITKVRNLPVELGGSVKAVALTGQPEEAAECGGFDLYLAKPADPAELLTVVARLAGQGHSGAGNVGPTDTLDQGERC